MDNTQGSMLKPMCSNLVFRRVRSGCYSSLPSATDKKTQKTFR